jgi:hypothetical protein
VACDVPPIRPLGPGAAVDEDWLLRDKYRRQRLLEKNRQLGVQRLGFLHGQMNFTVSDLDVQICYLSLHFTFSFLGLATAIFLLILGTLAILIFPILGSILEIILFIVPGIFSILSPVGIGATGLGAGASYTGRDGGNGAASLIELFDWLFSDISSTIR